VLPELPSELDAPILAMLHKEPAGRPATAGEAIAALVRAAEHAGYPVPAGMPHLPRPRELPAATPTAFSPPLVTPDRDSLATPSGERTRMEQAATAPTSMRRKQTVLWIVPVAMALTVAYLGWSALDAPAERASTPPLAGPGAPASVAAPAPVPAPPPPSTGAPASNPPAPVLADPPSEPSQPAPSPAPVQLTLRGAPPGARVQLGDELLGDASRPLRLPFGTKPIELTVSAPGHEPFSLSVVPDHDVESDVKLKKRPVRPKPKRGVPSDLENPF
jgi:hypothetical protein